MCVCGNIDLRLLIGGRPAAPARETTWCYSSWQSTPEPTSTIPDKMAGYENRVSMKARNNFIGVCLLQAPRKSINPQSLTLQGFSAPLSTMWSPHKPQHQLKPIQYWRRNLFFPSHKIYVCLNVPGLALPLLLPPATIMGDRGSEYRVVAREELEVFEMKVKLKDGFV